MISYAQAVSRIRKVAHARGQVQLGLSFEDLDLGQSLGRVLARDYFSEEAIPAFDNSAMDGFAVVAASTNEASHKNPARFTVAGSVAAGDQIPKAKTLPGTAWEIMTGAPFPPGYDACVKIEDVRVLRDRNGTPKEIEIMDPVDHQQHIRSAGADIQKGALVAKRGTVLMPEHILAFATLGITRAQVVRKPKVALLATGKELIQAGAALQSGQIRNSTTPFLVAALAQLGAEVTFFGNVTDDPIQFKSKMKQVLSESPDIILTTGGVSMGKFDFVKESLVDLGADIVFHHIAMRPGKPNLFAEWKGGPVVFGIPGNPVSTVVALRFLVEPYLREWAGRCSETPMRAQLQNAVTKPEKFTCFLKAEAEMAEGSPQVKVMEGQHSFQVKPLLTSNVWAVLSDLAEEAAPGAWVDIYPVYSFPYEWGKHVINELGTTQLPATDHKSHNGCC